ncbi:AbiH family protein [Seonamhaeicola sp.]|uniref:AbiH family protein n=1 Tax=Seonamhaeicola sp. TaxID=1912245 RepID=UPI002618E56E|nr:AbiH family protein [Seonamhaeicola sp.]
MNRIILIGNGFDLAHGMNTSYNHFLKDYWEKIITQLQHSAASNITSLGKTFENEEIIVDGLHGSWGDTTKIDATNFEGLLTNLKSQNINLSFKNKFLEILTKKQKELNWVDIEIEYYELLKKSFTDKDKGTLDYTIQQLNEDFERVKNLLEEYLLKIELEFDKSKNTNFSRTRNRIEKKIYSHFNLRDFSESSLNQKIDLEYADFVKDAEAFKDGNVERSELSKKRISLIQAIGADASREEFKSMMISQDAHVFFDLLPNLTLFLNFNYTLTELYYESPPRLSTWGNGKTVEFNHIHGSNRKEDKNPIIFGFGDELDEDYKKIERLNNNDYLENIKSIKYLDTDNYKRLLEFVNAGNYQIMIMGHSCGTSDRTLLNTVFENDNCASIKVFYHNKGDNKDNFSDIIKNISRNFNDKALMRDRVVNKTYCEPLN